MNTYTKNVRVKKEECLAYFMDLVKKLADTHELISSCNKDTTLYLIPKGTIDQLTYTSKPVDSYRFSDHWNWYANVNKCPNEHYVQCYNVDMPRVKPRAEAGKPSKPVFGICVAHFGDDMKYHHVFGEKFDRKTKVWSYE